MYPSNNNFLQPPRRYTPPVHHHKKHTTGLAIDTDYYHLESIPSLVASSPPTPLETSGSSVDSESSPPAATLLPWNTATTTTPAPTTVMMTTDDEEEDEKSPVTTLASPITTATTATTTTTPPPLPTRTPASFNDIFSKFNISYTDLGINMEARITNVSDFRVLIDAFSKLCCSTNNHNNHHNHHHTTHHSHDTKDASSCIDEEETSDSPTSTTSTNNGIVLYRNPNSRVKPVNFFASATGLGQILHPHSKHGSMTTLQQIVEACINTYFTCWIRYFPIMLKEEFMAWYNSHPSPTETLIVNALCSYCFRHMVMHHSNGQFEHFRQDPYQIQEQEEFFFNRARDCLGQSFDYPDRYAVLSLIYMGIRAEMSRRHHYLGMAVSMLHELEIYPRMALDAENESFEKEADTRLWWFAWSIDLYLYSSGAPKNTPQTRGLGRTVDIPRVFEQDIDDDELSVISYHYCIQFWQIQADIIRMLSDRESDMTVEQLNAYDQKIVDMYEALPAYLKFDSGFEYGCEELFLVCVRVNIEYNATRIILHKPFIPDVNDRYPGRFSLESLNICLSRSLVLLRALNTCVKVPMCGCAFDRDEMWRVAEVISNAMDIYRNCGSSLILNNIDKEEYHHGLQKCLDVIRLTHEHQQKNKDWVQVADWIEVEIRRHQLYTHPANNKNDPSTSQQDMYPRQNEKPDYFLANLKPSVALNSKLQASSSPTPSATTSSSSSSSSSASPSSPPLQQQQQTSHATPVPVPNSNNRMDHSQQHHHNYNQHPHQQQESSHHEITPSGSMLSVLSFSTTLSSSPSSTPPSSSNNSFNSSFMSSPTTTSPPSSSSTMMMDSQQQQQQSFVQMYAPPSTTKSFNASSSSSQQSKNQTRFRYFNPRKMNKFLFIDENPIV
ncbi:hypothetical protein BDA99DRAFT_529724 [Phascolomyces articulosus]|uniref:Transcription factor domain-containing protein n=1 Tax=Phascolomyces articulosus TaxID=60185 RepID=A0AAD5P745_9FUNG|nr:hypothetical protein BDA99DRAFT_529724 [Phascolomyces articulosus]